jgi:photosystem I P700 chlorophyll a apoprotein A2
MATKSNNWKVFLELLDKKLKLEKKDQKLNNRDSLQLLELIRSIKTCFMYSSKPLNTIGWTTFYWHWKHMTIWGGNPGQFNESSNYIMGWLRDYLWLNSSPLINGYNPFGMNNLSVWAWMFLFGHLIWATGFMFLISWRGYWQELIETLVWAHERTPLANLVRWRDKPVALSIVQARLVGLVHFAVGYILTYAAFVIASTSGKFA